MRNEGEDEYEGGGGGGGKKIGLVFANNLIKVERVPFFDREIGINEIWIIENPWYFGGDEDGLFFFNKKKILMYRMAMIEYFNELRDHITSKRIHGITIKYVEYANDYREYIDNDDIIYYYDPVDVPMRKELKNIICKERVMFDNPIFLLGRDDIDEYKERFKEKVGSSNNNKHKGSGKHSSSSSRLFFMTSFYKELRKEFGILIDNGSRPVGGKWTYDSYNRDSFKTNAEVDVIPKMIKFKYDERVFRESKAYVEKNFGDYYGNCDSFDWIPVTRQQAKRAMQKFVTERLKLFGKYQDALNGNWHNYHSGLSCALNIGLILPDELIEAVLGGNKDKSKKVKWADNIRGRFNRLFSGGGVIDISGGGNLLHSQEGFIRQVLGWREYMRVVYEVCGRRMIRENYFSGKKILGDEWYNGETKIETLDSCINRAFDSGYLHHIERLMVVCNLMNLSGVLPYEVYKWFMEFSIDSYEWVMVGNVYGMGLYASRMISTKVYISSSLYARGMGAELSPEGGMVWDALFWNFIWKHREKIKKIGRMKQMISFYKKKSKFDKEKYKIISHAFIKRTTLK